MSSLKTLSSHIRLQRFANKKSIRCQIATFTQDLAESSFLNFASILGQFWLNFNGSILEFQLCFSSVLAHFWLTSSSIVVIENSPYTRLRFANTNSIRCQIATFTTCISSKNAGHSKLNSCCHLAADSSLANTQGQLCVCEALQLQWNIEMPLPYLKMFCEAFQAYRAHIFLYMFLFLAPSLNKGKMIK